MNTLKFATAYVDRQGWSCIPIPYKQKLPPRIAWKEFQDRRPTTEELWLWFAHIRNNIAIITGDVSSRLLVLDFDHLKLFKLWQELCGYDSWAVVTGKGIHVYFWLAPDASPPLNGKFCVEGKIAGDVRYNGGYVLAPPSVHPSGQCYKWVKHGDYMLSVHVEELKITRPARKIPGRKHLETRQRQEPGAGATPGIPAYVKHPKAYAKAGLNREIQNILGATPGEDRNIKLFNAAWKLRRYAAFLGGDSAIERTLTEVGQRIGLPLPEVQRTIRSAFRYGT
jgi:hypothetical protein